MESMAPVSPRESGVKTSEPEVLSILDVIRIGSLQCEPA